MSGKELKLNELKLGQLVEVANTPIWGAYRVEVVAYDYAVIRVVTPQHNYAEVELVTKDNTIYAHIPEEDD